ncbi:hypothetical protein NQ314_001768 [Rhamnusium bicolor]|uniref:Uncharacterized protein n=1 Tax=Rhamnusium bicolor TaxID=1586634 RepID=A0AAV8ZSZ6_9CUCU|nr:hypothetical protein NQ314_001768 [Rhamnusium bicolor]
MVNNITYTCARVQSVNSQSAITNGCYKQKHGAYDTEVCVCKSGPGIYQPCNIASKSVVSISLLVILILFLYNFK